jgi:hypothetical protein
MSGVSSGVVPEEPRPQLGSENSAEEISTADAVASVSGVVLDTSGAAVSGASVSLTKMDRWKQQTVRSGANGEFTFAKLPPGSYCLIVSSKDFEPFTSAEFTLAAQQAYEVPRIALSVATAVTEVTVRPTEVIAAEQIKAEEKQRLIGIAPNFYTSYIYEAAPLTTKQKFSLAAHDTFDPTSFIGIAIGAGIQQANNSFSGYGQGAAGYGKRYGALFCQWTLQ